MNSKLTLNTKTNGKIIKSSDIPRGIY